MRHLMGVLARNAAHSPITLHPLNRAEVGQFLRASLLVPVPTATVDQIFSSTNGNPFLVNEIAREIRLRSATAEDDRDGRTRDELPLPKDRQG